MFTNTFLVLAVAAAVHPLAAPHVTSLTNSSVLYSVPTTHYVKIERGPIRMMIADNEAIDAPGLAGHREGYNGIASLTHTNRSENLFVPTVAGLNFEHIHDGTTAVDKERFEPRRAAMSLRVIDAFTVEVHQSPTPNWKLESCGRYQLLADGTIEYTFECIPRDATFQQGYIGLFWASYIDRPEDKAIHFLGREKASQSPSSWIRATTPRHGVESTHPPDGPLPDLKIDPNFSLTLVNHPSKYVYTEPWFYGVSHGMTLVQMFRPSDRIWFAQSPTGGGEQNPAWDFQWFIPDFQVGEAYGFVMRMAYIPYHDRDQIELATRPHRTHLRSPRPMVSP